MYHMTRPVRTLVVLVALALVAPVWESAPSADAAMNIYYGVVKHVRDGDTIVVDINPPGNGPEDPDVVWDANYGGSAIRLYGINAFGDEAGEEECWGPEATRFLAEAPSAQFPNALDLIGKTVELRGFTNHTPDQYGRIPMRVFLDGTDVAKTLLKAGLGLPMPSNELTDKQNNGYRKKADAAHEAVRRIWKDYKCGSGPVQTADFALRVRFDADGDDDQNLSGEWVEIINNGSVSVNLRNWEIRDSMWSRHVFTGDRWINPGKRVRVIGGTATLPPSTSTTTMVRWYNPDLSNTEEIFLNRGDIAALLDPDGDVRAFTDFPCADIYQDCSDPLSESIALWAQYNPPGAGDTAPNGDDPEDEWIDIWNLGVTDVDLYDHYIRNDVDTYLFDSTTVIAPGRFLRLRVGVGTNGTMQCSPGSSATCLVRYWGKSAVILADDGERIELMGIDGREVACYGYGNETCKKSPIPNLLEVTVVYDGVCPTGGESETCENANPNSEWVQVRNTTANTVYLSDFFLDIPIRVAQGSWTQGSAVFNLGVFLTTTAARTLDPGEVITFHMGSGTANQPAGHFYLGFATSPLFSGPGDTVNLWRRDDFSAPSSLPKIRLGGTFTWTA
jgi:endonuclease YncB( thermonuclease family)